MQVEKRYVYTTPKTFLELIRLYKSVLGRKRQQVQEAIDRLDTGLSKLQKTQREVDVLVEEAKIKAVEVEKKVADADIFAEQVSLKPPPISHPPLPHHLHFVWSLFTSTLPIMLMPSEALHVSENLSFLLTFLVFHRAY